MAVISDFRPEKFSYFLSMSPLYIPVLSQMAFQFKVVKKKVFEMVTTLLMGAEPFYIFW